MKPVVLFTVPEATHQSLFSRALLSPMSSQHIQTYYSLSVYFFLAFALCGLLAGLAYLFSISTAQETEKRSEYECGFAPFDSATRLPFDVHFYLVGILFLIFDVEVALLFPWVLALRTTGWFSFYLMLAFLAILTLGFLYEWKRGALIWPTRYSKKNYAPMILFSEVTLGETTQDLLGILIAPGAFFFVAVFFLNFLARWYTLANYLRPAWFRVAYLRVAYLTAALIFLVSLYVSYYVSIALAIVFFVSSYLENNPFWPTRNYWLACVLFFSFPSRFGPSPYFYLRRFWGCVLSVFVAVGVYALYNFYIPGFPPRYRTELLYEFFKTDLKDTLLNRGVAYASYLYVRWVRFPLYMLLHVPAVLVLGTPFVVYNHLMAALCELISPDIILALFLILWMPASVAVSYTSGEISLALRGNLYEKRAGDPDVLTTMRYLWVEAFFLVAASALAAVLYLADWALVFSLTNAALPLAPIEVVDTLNWLVARTLSAPADLFDLLHRARLYTTKTVEVTLTVLWVVYLKPLPAVLWKFKLAAVWLLFITRGYFYTEYMHHDEMRSFYGKTVYVISLLLYVFVVPVINFLYFSFALYNRVLATAIPYYTKYWGVRMEEKHVQIAATTTTTVKDTQALPVIAAVIVVDGAGNPLGLDSQTVLTKVTKGWELAGALMEEIADIEMFNEGLFSVVSILTFIVLCLGFRSVQLATSWLIRATIPPTAPAELIRKYTWVPRKASIWSWFFSAVAKETPADTYLCIDVLDDIAAVNAELYNMLSAVQGKAYLLEAYAAFLTLTGIFLFSANCYLSRMRQHHCALVHGILTDGALTIIAPKARTSSSDSARAVVLLGNASTVETLYPTHSELTSLSLAEYPLFAEGVLFILICAVITKLSSDLGKEHNKRFLAYTSWKILSLGLFAIAFIYAYQFIFDGGSTTILGGYFATSRTITLLKLVTLVSAVFVLDASETFMRQHSRHLLEYPIMVALTTLFMLLLVSANHVMSAFLCLVGFSLGLYVLILYDANKRPSREAGLKYYYLSTLSSGFILYGILLIYTLTGTGNFDELFLLFNAKLAFQENALLRTALLLILTGFFFKLSAVPGHLWAADVYEGSPSPVTAFFMLPVKIVVLGAFIRVFSVALAPLAAYWLPLLTLAVIISIVWGALASVQEKKVRRFLAYASINQMGFLLMGFTTDSDEGYQAALLYIVVYAVMTCAFLAIFLSARRQDGSELLYVSDFRTLAVRNWLVGWSLAVILFSMAGIPPLGGFFAKYLVLLHAFEKNLIVEVVVGLATSLVSTYYYLRIIKIVKFEQPDGAMPSAPCLTPRRQGQLFIAEALLWSFILFAPVVLSLTYTLALTQGPACLVI